MFLSLFSLAGFTVDNLYAFQSVKLQTLSASVTTGGVGAQLKIVHIPLQSVSPVTRLILVQGEVGEEPRSLNPPYEARRTPQSDFGPLETRKIRVTLRYRFVPNLGISEAPSSEEANSERLSGPIEGPDPFGFVFQIDPNVIIPGIFQYRIITERLEIINGLPTVVLTETFPTTTPSNPEPWVNVGSNSQANQVISTEGGRFVLSDGNPNDGETSIEIPSRFFSEPTTLSLNELSLSDSSIPLVQSLSQAVAVYHLEAERPFKGSLPATFLYPDFVFPEGQRGILGETGVSENHTSLLWWDGFKWRRLGGTPNTLKNTISARIGLFSYLAIVPGGALSPQERRPDEKIVTPNGDGINESAVFSFELTQNVNVEIYDVTGHRVRTLHYPSTLEWDGRDDSGQVVESGVYIYQYQVDGERVSGLIAVAK